MVVYGIPASLTGFADREVSQPSDRFVGGRSTMEKAVYFGPGTLPNTGLHDYTWTLVAADLNPKALPLGMTGKNWRPRSRITSRARPGSSPASSTRSGGLLWPVIKRRACTERTGSHIANGEDRFRREPAGTNARGLGRWRPCERHAQLLIASPPLGLRCRISREPRPFLT